MGSVGPLAGHSTVDRPDFGFHTEGLANGLGSCLNLAGISEERYEQVERPSEVDTG